METDLAVERVLSHILRPILPFSTIGWELLKWIYDTLSKEVIK